MTLNASTIESSGVESRDAGSGRATLWHLCLEPLVDDSHELSKLIRWQEIEVAEEGFRRDRLAGDTTNHREAMLAITVKPCSR